MSIFNSKRYFYLLIVILLFAFKQVSFANSGFENNLLKAEFSKNSIGGVKLNLYTSKPYKDSVVVNKKSDSEYVLLMPETANSLTNKPTLNSTSDVVRRVDVKTQQYAGNIKGYTKIVITTTKPIEIVPHVQTFASSANPLSEKDYNELLSQTSKKQSYSVGNKPKVSAQLPLRTKMPVKNVVKNSTNTTSKNNLDLKDQLKKQISAKKKSIIEKLPIKNERSNLVKKEEIQKNEKSKKKLAKTTSIKEDRPKNKISVEKTMPKQNIQGIQVSQKAKSVDDVDTSKNSSTLANKVPAVSTSKETSGKVAENKAPEQTTVKTSGDKVSAENKGEGFLSQSKQMIVSLVGQSNVSFIKDNGVILASSFVLLLLLLRIFKRKAKNVQAKAFDSKASGLGAESLNVEDESDDLSWKDKFQSYVDSTEQVSQDSLQTNDEVSQDIDGLFNNNVDYDEAENIAEQSVDDYLESGSDKTSFADDIETSKISPEIMSDIDDSFVQDFNKMPVSQDYQANEESLLEDIFGEDDILPVESVYDDEFESESELESELNVQEEAFEFESDFIEEDQPFEDLQSAFAEEAESEDVTREEEVVKSEFAIDNNKGLYLVDFENATALVGQINDEIFVLKRFDSVVSSPLQVRLNEQSSISSNYMVKAGRFKALVDVKQDSMSLLIEL